MRAMLARLCTEDQLAEVWMRVGVSWGAGFYSGLKDSWIGFLAPHFFGNHGRVKEVGQLQIGEFLRLGTSEPFVTRPNA